MTLDELITHLTNLSQADYDNYEVNITEINIDVNNEKIIIS